MQIRAFVGTIALLAAVMSFPAQAAETPTLVMRMASIDELIAQARYLAVLAGKEEEAKQAEAFLKGMTGPKGLEGLDTKKPFGFYAVLGESIERSSAVALIPVADEKTLMNFLQNVGIRPEKEDEVYKFDLPNSPFPGFFRFANGYAYITGVNAKYLTLDRLQKPEAVFGNEQGTLSFQVNLDQIPKPFKELFLTQLALRMSDEKDKTPPGDETKVAKALRLELLDEVEREIKSLLDDGQTIRFEINVDRQANDLKTALTMTARPGSKLADSITELGKATTVSASLVSKQTAMNMLLSAGLPERIRKAIAPVLEEEFDKALKKEKDKTKRDLGQAVFNAISPTLKAAEFDGGLDIRGPSRGGLYTVVVGMKVKDGGRIEKTVKDIFTSQAPPEAKAKVTFDADKAGGVAIHKVINDNPGDAAKMIGTGPIFFAVRDDALLVAGGEEALDALKEVIQAKPTTGALMQMEMAVNQLVKLMEQNQKNAEAAAKIAFAKAPEGDRIRLALTAGKALTLSLNIKAQLITFFAKLDELNKKRDL